MPPEPERQSDGDAEGDEQADRQQGAAEPVRHRRRVREVVRRVRVEVGVGRDQGDGRDGPEIDLEPRQPEPHELADEGERPDAEEQPAEFPVGHRRRRADGRLRPLADVQAARLERHRRVEDRQQPVLRHQVRQHRREEEQIPELELAAGKGGALSEPEGHAQRGEGDVPDHGHHEHRHGRPPQQQPEEAEYEHQRRSDGREVKLEHDQDGHQQPAAGDGQVDPRGRVADQLAERVEAVLLRLGLGGVGHRLIPPLRMRSMRARTSRTGSVCSMRTTVAPARTSSVRAARNRC